MTPGFTRQLIVQLLASLLLAGWLLSTLQRPADPTFTLGLVLLGALLEVMAVAWPSMGFSSSAPACYLALALLPGCPAGWGVISLVLGVTLRSLSRGAPGLPMRVREATASAFPVLLALAAAKAYPEAGAFLPIDVYLPAAFLAPAALAADLDGPAESRWRKVRARTVLAWLSTGFLAPPLATLKSLWLVPVLFGLQRSAQAAVEAVREDEQRRLATELEGSRRSVQRAKEEVSQVRKELEVKVEERALFEELARQFTQSPDQESTRAATVQMALRLVPSCCSAALFDAELAPVAYQTPQRKRLESSGLLGLHEPIVVEAARQQRPIAFSGDAAERIFLNENAALALPVPGAGVLYVGSLQPAQLPEGLLRLLCQQAGEALQAAARYQEMQARLQDSSKLQAELTQLSGLLQACLRLSQSLQVSDILDTLEGQLEQLAPHHSRTLVWSEHRRGHLPENLLATLLAGGRPLLIEDTQRGKVPPLQPQERSLLAVPLGDRGMVALGHTQPASFSRDHLDALQVLALQATLALQNGQLHQQIQDALAKLTESEAQLVQSSKMAAVGQLAAGVAHEINTPLATMMLAIQGGMTSKALPEQLKALLQRAEKAGTRARDIVQKLLYYSRDARVGRRCVQLEKVMRDTLDLIGQQLRLDKVVVEIEAQPMAEVMANENELQQVLTNLMMNARDALLSQEQRRILVRIYPEAQAAITEVNDNGPGVDPEVANRIFDPFFTTKGVGQGTGLGLSVSQQLIESHQGTLTYHRLTSGSCFRVALPWPEEEAEGG